MRGLHPRCLDVLVLDSALEEEALEVQVLAGIRLARKQLSGANKVSPTLGRTLPLLSTLPVQLQRKASQPSEVLLLGIFHSHLSAMQVPRLLKNLHLLPYVPPLKAVQRTITTMTFLLSHN